MFLFGLNDFILSQYYQMIKEGMDILLHIVS